MRFSFRQSLRPTTADRLLWVRRLGWMAAIWSASVAAVGLVSWMLRLWLKA